MHFALRFYIQKARPFVDKYDSKHTGSRPIVQAKIGGTYGQMRTDGVYTRRNKRSIHTRRQKNEKAKIQELYVRMTKHIFGTSLSHNVL